MDISARSLHIKREVITKLLNEGLYPYTKRYLGSFDNHFSTIGLVGMNEAGLNAKWLGCDMSDPRTQKFTKEVLTHMRNRLSDYQEEYPGELFNLEATPAESMAYRLAKHDRKRWPDIRTAGSRGDTPYYTNSSHLPVEYTTDIFDALDIQDELQTLYTSGTVFHAFIGEKLPDWKAAAALVRKIAENYKLPYYTISPTYSVCKEHGYISGEHFTCPKCGKKAEVYSRITGYYRPVQNWNDGKAQEYKNRTLYDVMHSDIRKIQPVHASVVTVTKDDVKIEPVASHKYLFTTSTCPNCRVAKKILEGREFEIIDAEKNPEMVKEFGIMQAPTLVITDVLCNCVKINCRQLCMIPGMTSNLTSKFQHTFWRIRICTDILTKHKECCMSIILFQAIQQFICILSRTIIKSQCQHRTYLTRIIRSVFIKVIILHSLFYPSCLYISVFVKRIGNTIYILKSI